MKQLLGYMEGVGEPLIIQELEGVLYNVTPGYPLEPLAEMKAQWRCENFNVVSLPATSPYYNFELTARNVLAMICQALQLGVFATDYTVLTTLKNLDNYGVKIINAEAIALKVHIYATEEDNDTGEYTTVRLVEDLGSEQLEIYQETRWVDRQEAEQFVIELKELIEGRLFQRVQIEYVENDK